LTGTKLFRTKAYSILFVVCSTLVACALVSPFARTGYTSSRAGARAHAGPKSSKPGDRPATVRAAGRGAPLVNLRDGYDLAPPAAGEAPAPDQSNSGNALSAVVADFDEDGAPDLACGYAGGRLTLYRSDAGVPVAGEATAPRRAVRAYADAQLSPVAQQSSLPPSPDLMLAGDFNADGHQDVLSAALGGDWLTLLPGTGRGTFGGPRRIALKGSITALAAGEIGRADGQADLAVAITTAKGAQLVVFEHPEGAFAHPPEVFKLPAPATDIAIADFDGDNYADIAVVSGDELTVVHERAQAYPWDLDPRSGVKRPAAVVERRALPFRVAGLASGRFSDQRGASLAALADGGSLYLLEPDSPQSPAAGRGAKTGGARAKRITLPQASRSQAKSVRFAPTAVDGRRLAVLDETAQAVDETTAAQRGLTLIDSRVSSEEREKALTQKFDEAAKQFKALPKDEQAKVVATKKAEAAQRRQRAREAFLNTLSAKPAPLAAWRLQTLTTDARLAGVANSRLARKLVSARVSTTGRDDLALVDPNNDQLQLVVMPSAQSPTLQITSLDVSGSPAAVVPVRLNGDAFNDLVVLRGGSASPSVVLSAPAETIVVNTTIDDFTDCGGAGPCSLRSAIERANQIGGAEIDFDIPGDGVHTIHVQAQLPVIIRPVTIEGGTQPGFGGTPIIEIKGDQLSGQGGVDGLKIRASNCFVDNLDINSFPAVVDENTGSLIGGNGLTIESTNLSPNNGSNIVANCFLGTDPTGTVAEGNQATGLNIFDADSNAVAFNVISGNSDSGGRAAVGVSVTAGNNNFFAGNKIGTNAAGTAKLGNVSGMLLTGSNNQVGGDGASDGNTISGNGIPYPQDFAPGQCRGTGLLILPVFSLDTGEMLTSSNSVKGNRIGTTSDGLHPLGNCEQGIATTPIVGTVIGSITRAGRNVVSDNGWDAVHCEEIPFDGVDPTEGGFCAVVGNNIGTDITGAVAMGNDWRNVTAGLQRLSAVVDIYNNVSLSNVGAPGGATQGGACTGFCNLISGNSSDHPSPGGGIGRNGSGTVGVFNNFIGTDQGGTRALANDNNAVVVAGPGDTQIGLYAADQSLNLGNLISGNTGSAVALGAFVASTATDTVEANLMGTDTTGAAAIPNGTGVSATAVPGSSITIGNTSPSARNYISGNNGNGVSVLNRGGAVQIVNNYIGYSKNSRPLGNGRNGVLLQGVGSSVGGTDAGTANLIAYNTDAGVQVLGNDTDTFSFGNTIRGNSIHDNGGLGIDLSLLQPPYTEAGDGVTPNDVCDMDADGGPNFLQNFPELFAPTFNQDGTVTVTGVLHSTPSRNFTIDVYADTSADPSGYGEGETYLGATTVTTDTNGFASFSFTSGTQVSSSAFFSATATDDFGDTSEFSQDVSHATGPQMTPEKLKEKIAAAQEVCPGTLIVNTAGDESDANPDDGLCDVDVNTPDLQCTLRAALEVTQKPGYSGPRLIRFDIPGGGAHTITPASPLPQITNRITIDGSSQPGYIDRPLIELRGDSAGNADGLVFAAGSDGSSVGGLIVNRFSGAGIVLGSNQNEISSTYVGLLAGGISVEQDGRQQIGVKITGSGNRLLGLLPGRNYFAGNIKYQVLITGSGATNNELIGNGVGVLADAPDSIPLSGTVVQGPAVGIGIAQGASGNVVGGTTTSQLNLVAGSYIGIYVSGGAPGNRITHNVSYGNFYGIAISRATGNYIGELNTPSDPVNFPGNTVVGNGVGIFLGDEDLLAQQPTGGSSKESKDYFARAAGLDQIAASAAQTRNNFVESNAVGFGAKFADFDKANDRGIVVGTAGDNTIGGSTGVPGKNVINFVCQNKLYGIELRASAFHNTVEGNWIGVSPNESPLPNGTGLLVSGSQNQINKNTISGNTGDGVTVSRPSSSDPQPAGNVFRDNRIGTNQGTDKVIKNGANGISLDGTGNSIGVEASSTGRGYQNVISGNGKGGIAVSGDGNTIVNNIVGTNIQGATDFGNVEGGIVIAGSNNLIRGNVSSGNQGGIGIKSFEGSTPTGNRIQKNRVGTNIAGTAKIPNTFYGIVVTDASSGNYIGGFDPPTGQSLGNLVSGNGTSGIAIVQQKDSPLSPSGNFVQGNLIGTDAAGASAIPNDKCGIFIYNSGGNVIGGFGADLPGARNVISGNTLSGVQIAGTGAFNNRISGNYIGTQIDGASPLANNLAGVYIFAGAHDNTSGGEESHAGNVIANNVGPGVYLRPDAGTGNKIDPNSIYANTQLGIDLDTTGATGPDDGNEATTLGDGQPLPNDAGDADTGPNNLQNFPVIASASVDGDGNLQVSYYVDSAPGNSDYGDAGLRVEFFTTDPCSNQGRTFVGSDQFTQDDYFNGAKTVNLGPASQLGVGGGSNIVATATDADGNTSEFSVVGSPVNASAAGAKPRAHSEQSENAPALIISEFRLRGPAGAQDEFVEFYNNSAEDITVSTSDGSSGWTLAAYDGSTVYLILTIPNGTTIPTRAHLLAANDNGYSLAGYAAGDLHYAINIPDNAGLSLFYTADANNFTAAYQLDAVGFNLLTGPTAALYREGAGLPALPSLDKEHSFVRKLTTGLPQDTGDNAQDFALVSTEPISFGCGRQQTSVLGAPAPENLASPLQRNGLIKSTLLDTTHSADSGENRVRVSASDPASHATYGTLSLRRTFTNNTGAPVSRLRFRVVDITTLGSPGYGANGQADLRALTSPDVDVTINGRSVTIRGTTLEQPAQPNAGGLNSGLAVGAITLNDPLPPGQSVSVQFLLGVETRGYFRFFVNIEAAP
jgi:CSLREA domain-containing protein